LKVDSDPANLAAVRKQVEALALAHGFSAKVVAEIGLCVNEAMANVIPTRTATGTIARST